MSYLTIDPAVENRRQAYLEWLYRESGRDQRTHPQHSIYTGLLDERRTQLIAADMESFDAT